jgi:hypothetical protein
VPGCADKPSIVETPAQYLRTRDQQLPLPVPQLRPPFEDTPVTSSKWLGRHDEDVGVDNGAEKKY